MKKLFKLGHSLTIDEYETVRITGPVTLIQVEETHLVVQQETYTIHMTGQDLLIDLLDEEMMVVSFSTLSSLEVRTKLREDS